MIGLIVVFSAINVSVIGLIVAFSAINVSAIGLIATSMVRGAVPDGLTAETGEGR